MRRFVRGSWTCVYQFFILADLQAEFPPCTTRGAGVVGTSTYPSIPNTTVNVMRPKRPNRTSPLSKANRPRLFTTCSVYTNLRYVGFHLLSETITRACGVNFRALFTHMQTKLRIEHGTIEPSTHVQSGR
jgi:hypothetical protein